MSVHRFTENERELARRIWAARNALALSEDDRGRGLDLGLIVWPYASNLCNDVCHGHYMAKGPR